MSDVSSSPVYTPPGQAYTPANVPTPRGPGGGTVEREFTVKERSQISLVLRRFLRHRAAVVSLVVLVLVALLCYVGRRFWPHDYEWLDGPGSASPSLQYPMGTDTIGHDYFARVLRGGQQSFNVAFVVMAMSSLIGAPYGAIAGYFGGRIDNYMMRFVDVLLTLPFLAVVGAMAHHFQGHWYVVALLLGALGWVVNARVVRGSVLSLRNQEFVEAARALGASNTRIIFRHLLPNVTGVIIVQATLDIAGAILGEAALSFVGLGIQSPDTSLGSLANDARDALGTRDWLFYFPGLMIIVIALCINFIGDGLRDALDPRQTRQRR
jgi:ABC-type dipeptide/oligopeptide/nickel transport system permease subunit